MNEEVPETRLIKWGQLISEEAGLLAPGIACHSGELPGKIQASKERHRVRDRHRHKHRHNGKTRMCVCVCVYICIH